MSRAIILAAGKGTRLVHGMPYPKPLEHVGGVPLIARVIRSLEKVGVTDVGIIVGHLGDVLRESLEGVPFRARLHFFVNDEFDKPNGTSLLKAADFVTEPTFVVMSDHLWSPQLGRAVARFPLATDEAVLGVDRNWRRCFDLDDATKVRVRGDRITAIGKEIPRFDVLDTGVFRITPAFIDALREADGPDGCSLSQGVQKFASEGRMRVADVGDAMWIDVDTPDAKDEAERLLARYGDDLEAPRREPVRLVASA